MTTEAASPALPATLRRQAQRFGVQPLLAIAGVVRGAAAVRAGESPTCLEQCLLGMQRVLGLLLFFLQRRHEWRKVRRR